MSIKKRNLLSNRLTESGISENVPICGQGIGAVASMRYGICRMSFNGCECIAVYNALLRLGRRIPLSEAVHCMEKHRLMLGIFGGNPLRIGKTLGRLSVPFRKTRAFDLEGGYIISFWTKRPFLSQFHTVFAETDSNGITVYNRYSNSTETFRYQSVGEMLGERRLISAYYVGKLT